MTNKDTRWPECTPGAEPVEWSDCVPCARSEGDDDPRAHYQCDWPGCQVHGDPWFDKGWCFYPRYYLWLPDGFFCPEHTAFIEEGKRTDYFKDWPRDMNPEALELQEAMAQFAPLDSEESREIMAKANRSAFYVVKDE